MKKSDYIIHTDPLAPHGSRALFLSDLHMGHHESRFEEGWQFAKHEVGNGTYDTIIIGGDFTDRNPYSNGETNEEHTEFLANELRDLLSRNPKAKVRFILGNHDLAAEFVDTLYKLQDEFGDRFGVCDILRIGDSIFHHGDDFEKHYFKNPRQLKTDHKNRLNASVSRPVDYEENATMEIEKRLARNLAQHGIDYSEVQHIFFGHIHPFTPGTRISPKGKKCHITGCSFIDFPNSILCVTFDDARATGVEEVFSQPAVSVNAHGWNPEAAGSWQRQAAKREIAAAVSATR